MFLQVALTELGDGATLVWRRLSPAYRRDQTGLCRQLTYSPSLCTFVREVEGIACRERGGGWSLQG
jgi:hypothetical protein